MTDRPIIFSAPMVRALLEGRKTQMRRVLRPQPFSNVHPSDINTIGDADEWERVRIPYAPGDRFWVREAFTEVPMIGPRYYATNEIPASFKKVSPIHMPRWASRLTLLVTDVRVQRLQEISEANAISEGIYPAANSQTIDCDTPPPSDGFRALWNSIHGPDAWDANPWVAAITFDVKRGNIDTPTGGTNDRD